MVSTELSNTVLERLKNRPDFLHIQKNGKRWTAKGLTLQGLENKSLAKNAMRVGFTVTKRVHSSAVKRNRIKRRMRAAAKEILPTHAKTQMDYILVGRLDALTRPYTDLCSDLRWCLGKMDFAKTIESKESTKNA